MSKNPKFNMELEHAIAFAGGVPGAAHLLPNGKEYVVAAGCLVAVCDLTDPHNQVFLRQHTEPVTCLAVSSTGALAASGQSGKQSDVVIWDLQERCVKYTLSDHHSGIQTVDFAPGEERFFLSVGGPKDRRVIVWDMDTGYIVGSRPMEDLLVQMRWGGRVRDIKGRQTTQLQMAAIGLNFIQLWTCDPATGELTADKVSTGKYKREYTCLCFSYDQKHLYAGTKTGDVMVISMKRKAFSTVLSTAAVGAVTAITPGGKHELFVGCADGSVTQFVHEESEFVDISRTVLQGAVTSLSISTDKTEYVAGTAAGSLYRGRTEDLQHVLLSDNQCSHINAVEFPPGASDRFVIVSDDGSVRVWDLADYTVMLSAAVPSRPLCCSYGEDVILVGCEDGYARAVDAANGEVVWEVAAHSSAVTAIKMGKNQKFFVTGSITGLVRVWNTRTRECVCTLKEHRQSINGIVAFDDNAHVLSVSQDRVMVCWDLQTESRISSHKQKMGGINAIALSADEAVVLTAGQEKSITMWDLRETQPLHVIAPAHDGEGMCLAVASNGAMFASGGTDAVVDLWDAKTGHCMAQGVGHSAQVRGVAFSADCNQLVSVGDDDCIFVWNIYDMRG